MALWKQVRTISLALPEELLADVDQAAKAHYMSRSEYIRAALHRASAKQQTRQTKKYITKDSSIDDWFLDTDDS